MLKTRAFSHPPLSANVAYKAHVAQSCANTNIKPMQQESSLSSLNMIHHAMFSFHTDVKLKKKVKKKRK
jgi:hypothetical protein